MRAARRERYGAADAIEVQDVPVPTPAPGEVLVRVHASTVSRTDCALLAARPFILRFMTGLRRPKLQTLGTDFAGRVAAVGQDAEGFEVGDAVWGMNDMGAQSHAEYLVIATTDSLGTMPDGLSFADGAACLEGAWYAHNILVRAGFSDESRVLINGATGAIGSALLQLCSARGAQVTAVGNVATLPVFLPESA